MNRDEMMSRILDRTEPWDMLIVGGGATGIGIAVDAASRGYDILLVEQSDYGKGTSSRSTKLVHGGVRYLQQGNITLVMEALKELDKVAYIRFASVYRSFEDIREFGEEIAKLEK